MANSRGGIIVIGSKEKDDGTIDPVGLEEFKDKAVINNEIAKYISPGIDYEILDFSYDSSEYHAVQNKKYQLLIVHDTPERLPFISLNATTNLERDVIYVRRGTKCEKASAEEIEKMINYKIETIFKDSSDLSLQEHLSQLKQLYGESEGKDHKGIFPASVDFTTDLHSMGQWIQDGERSIFETVISIEKANKTVLVPMDAENLDGLNFLAGKRVDEVNKMAELGTQLAHVDGGVPNIHITFEKIDEYNIGQFIYFFERGCGISGYVLDVNPFNQPGVEAYKKNMFALLDKPGYEAESKAIKARLA